MRALSRLRDGLVGAWCPSIGGWGGNVLRDLSGQGNHGTLTNMDPATDWVVSEGKQALDFDGSDDRILASASPIAVPGKTVAAWIRHTGAATTRYIVSQEGMWWLYLNSTGNVGFRYQGQFADNLIASTSSVVSGSFVHVCGQKTGEQLKVFINGVEDGSTSLGGFGGTTGTVHIGIRSNGTGGFLGQLDDIRTYNRALSPNEIRLLASERGIGLKPERKRRYVQGQTFNAARLRRQSLIGSGVY